MRYSKSSLAMALALTGAAAGVQNKVQVNRDPTLWNKGLPVSQNKVQLLDSAPLGSNMVVKDKDDQKKSVALKTLLHNVKDERDLSSSRQLQTFEWFQVGDTISGSADGGQFGTSVATSSDGTIVAVGAPTAAGGNGGGLNRGQVRVYKFDGTNYVQRGATIEDGVADQDKFGSSVALSSDGSILAVGAVGANSNAGTVKVYAWNGSAYFQRGNDLNGDGAEEKYGWSLALSASGDVLAASSGHQLLGNTGYVRVYEFNQVTGDYSSRGVDLFGEVVVGDLAAADQFGNSVAMSEDGSILAIGVPGASRVEVYKFHIAPPAYHLIQPINADSAFGSSVALSGDGKILAVSSPLSNSLNGRVNVFQIGSTTGIWGSIGKISGESGDLIGSHPRSVSLSADGNIVAIAGSNAATGSLIRVFEYFGGMPDYAQVGSDINGEAGDEFWTAVALSAGGGTLVGGAPTSLSNENGIVRVVQIPASPEIVFVDKSADFSATSEPTDPEMVLTYYIGRDSQYKTFLKEKNCVADVNHLGITPTETKTPKDFTHDSLVLAYEIDMSGIATSNIWTSPNKIELCQVVQLIVPADTFEENLEMVVEEDKRVIDITFDLSVDYATTGSLALDTADIEVEEINRDGDVATYVEAYQCSGVEFIAASAPLEPNDELVVCIESTSNFVEIDYLDTMIVSQDGDIVMTVINDGSVAFPSITSREYVPTEKGVVVSTRLPSDQLNYNGGTITIAGTVFMQSINGAGGRKLRAEIAPKLDPKEEGSFELEVAMQQQMLSKGEGVINSATSSGASAILVSIGAVFAVAYIVFW